MIENWLVYQRPFEYEYRCTEYEYDEDRNALMLELVFIQRGSPGKVVIVRCYPGLSTFLYVHRTQSGICIIPV